jgi:hypothetical protein
MPVGREEAILLASEYYTSRGFAVVRSRDDLPVVRADLVLVFLRAVHSTESPSHPPEMAGRFWWVAFEEQERVGGAWAPPSVHPSGGLVRVDESTGELYHPPAL